MKFLFYVEGHTEGDCLPGFFASWLNKRLNVHVGVSTVRFQGAPHLLRDISRSVRSDLSGPKARQIIAAIGLLDLYGYPSFPEKVRTVEDRYRWATESLCGRVNHSRFRAYFAVHEIEAWLLSQPDIFPREIRDALPPSVKIPENVDFDQPPARLLNNLYQRKLGHKYAKLVEGRRLFGKLDAEVAYKSCPHLREMLDDLLKMAKDAGL